MKRRILISLFALSCLYMAAPGTDLYAQAQSSSNSTTTGITSAAAASSTSTLPLFSSLAGSSASAAQGAGSDNNGYISFKAYVFKVHRGDDPSVIETTAGGTITAVRNFDYGTEWAPKVEGGWNGPSGWGFRASYFYTNQNAEENVTGAATAPFFLSPRPLNVTFTGAATAGTPATFRERLRIQYFDGEGSYKWKGPNSSTVLSAGIRIAPTRQVYTANDTFGLAPSVTEVLSYTQKRTGVGPTVAIDFRHRLGGSNFWFTAHGRFSYLWGKIKEDASFTNSAGTNVTGTRSFSRNTPVLEGEAGLEYSKKFGGGNEFFLNASFAAQQWYKLLNVVPVNAVGGSGTSTLDNPTIAPTKKGDVGLVGGSFSLGFRF